MKQALAALMLLTMIVTAPALAEVASRSEALAVAEAFVAEQTAYAGQWGESAEARVTDCFELRQDGELLCYWAPVEPSGHVIVSLIKEMPAVKAWSDTDRFDPDADHGYTVMIKEVFQRTHDYMRENFGGLDALPADIAPASNRDQWERLLSGAGLPRSRETVGPILSTVWHQESPYWDDCPPGDGGQCLVGCVATSAAMIMKYWEYPEYGSGNHGYNWEGDTSCGGSTGGEYLYADFSDPYDWENMRISYMGDYTPEEAAAVAEINYEAGVAWEMMYGHCASGTYVYMGEDIYPTYFRYNPMCDFVQRSAYTQAEWWDLIVHELMQFPPRPIHYRITQHSIVCDGINTIGETHYYHQNFGWGGGSNAWYALDNITCTWGCDLMDEAIVHKIEPLGYFEVTSPDAETVWYHDEPVGLIEWSGSEGSEVIIDLYQGDDKVATVVDWTANDGSETPGINVDPAWGTGSDFRLKIVDDVDKFGFSEAFGIYGGESWTDVTTTLLGDTGRGEATAWGDLDGDGWMDLYTTNDDQMNHCYDNDGGVFTDMTAPPLDLVGEGRGAKWADYDNDGDLDLYVCQTGGDPNYLFRNDGGVFTDVTAGDLGDTSYSEDCAWGDYDADGYLDLFVVNVYSGDKLFHNNADGSFSVDIGYPVNDSGYGRSAVWADYDGDGDQDLYLVRNGTNRLYQNNDGTSFTRITTAPVGDGGNGYGAAWGDYNSDGYLDLYIVNDGANKLLRNNGDGTFTDVTSAPLDDSGAGRSAIWGDYDNDGDMDLFVSNDGGNHLYKNQGGGVFTEATDPLLGDSNPTLSAGWADYDKDGDLDIYLCNNNAENKLIRNDLPPDNHWLQIKLQGTDSNLQGLGAKIRVIAGGVTMYHAVGGDAGYQSQNMEIAHFGLGEAVEAASVRVYWPSGAVQDTTYVPADQLVLIEEAGSGTAVDETAHAGTHLFANYPNPFNPKTEIRFGLDAGAQVDLAVFDLSGRLVRQLAAGQAFEPGTHKVIWDGRDAAGRPQGSGIYFYRLKAGDFEATRKMTILK